MQTNSQSFIKSIAQSKDSRRFLPLLLGPMLLISLLLLLIGWTSTTAFSQLDTNLERTPWQIHQGIPSVGKTNDITTVQLTGLQDLKAFEVVNIPPITDTDWLLPTEEQLDDNKDISIDVQSKLNDCRQNVDFTYFQTEVTVPQGTTLVEFQVTFAKVDDNARIYVFNSTHDQTNGFIVGGEIHGNNAQSVDLSSLVMIGEKNRVVIAQVDTCAIKNTIKNIQIAVKGTNADGTPLEEDVPVGHNALYVDKDATGQANGSSWKDAFTNVQDALAVAKSGKEIWVAEGVYYPDVGGGKTDNDRNAHFAIPSGVALYGGFDGTETLLDERDWQQYVTVLSGDVDGNDTTDAKGVVASPSNIAGDNSLHVISLDGTTNAITGTTFIDGFVITAGQANGAQSPDNGGGGLFCNGFATGECSPTLMNVTFSGNKANANGGAMFNDGRSGGKSSPTLTNVIFRGNSAQYGGALYNYGGGAKGGSGGNSNPTLTNVIFSGNFAEVSGGAIMNQGEENGNSSPTLTNVTFNGNSAKFSGGAIYNYGMSGNSSPTLTNVILWNNSAPQGPSIYNLDNATATISHSIVQSGTQSITGTSTIALAYDSNTNLDTDPLFVQPVDPASAPTSTGNLWLQVGSPAINTGRDNALPTNITTDLDGNNRISDGAVDLGAYEFLPSTVQGRVVDATTDKPILEANVCIRNTTLCAITDSSGNYTITNVSAGEQILDVTASGYTSVEQPFTTSLDKPVTQNFALSPQLSEGELRIVLMWGEHPRDLDSHLWLPSAQPYHIYYVNKGGLDNFPSAHLDIDDTESHGPETITVKLASGLYTYAVLHYAGEHSIPTSGAYVRVYGSTGLIGEYTPPPQGDGIWWHVFNFDGATGQTTEVNVLQSESPAPYQDK